MSAVLIADKLRASLLQAAIQGKLTTQLPEDGDAHDLLKEIEAEKARLIEEKVIRKEKPLPPLTEDEIPFEIPENWVWVRLGDLCSKVGAGSTPSGGKAVYLDNGIKFIRSQNVHNDGLYLDNVVFIAEKTHVSKKGSTVYPKDLLLNITGGSIGRCCIVPDDFDTANINQHVLILRLFDNLLRYYLHRVITSPFIFNLIMSLQVGGTKEGLSATSAKNLLIPLPPLAEQHRIVEAIETALVKIDKLKTDESKLYDIQKAFPNKLRASLLQSAIQGQLTDQLPEDGDARDLLKEIEAEKARLIEEKVIRKEKALPSITEDEIPFEIPENWVWVRLGSVTYNRGQKKPIDKFTYIDIASIDNKNQKLGSSLAVIEAKNAPSRARKVIQKGDVIYATVRPYLLNTCIIDRDISPEPIVSTGFAVLTTPFSIMNRYLLYLLISPFFNSYANDTENAKGVAYPAINDTRLKLGLLPIPPLVEQQRIVEKLDGILGKVNNLSEITN